MNSHFEGTLQSPDLNLIENFWKVFDWQIAINPTQTTQVLDKFWRNMDTSIIQTFGINVQEMFKKSSKIMVTIQNTKIINKYC